MHSVRQEAHPERLVIRVAPGPKRDEDLALDDDELEDEDFDDDYDDEDPLIDPEEIGR